MGSAHKGGRGAEPLCVGLRVGFQGCRPGGEVYQGASSAQHQKPMRQAGRKRPRSPQDAVSGRQQLPGRGAAALRSRPRLPYGFWLGGTGTPRSRGVQAYVRPLTLPSATRSGNPRVAEAPVPGKMPCRLPSPPLTRPENPLNRGHNPDAPVEPRPLPSPGPKPSPGQLPSPPLSRGGPSLA